MKRKEFIMPKLKTNKAVAKRYSITATGKVKRTKSNGRHLFATKHQDKNVTKSKHADKTVEAGIKSYYHMVTKTNNYYTKILKNYYHMET